MSFKIISAEERLAEKRRVKAVIFGPSGVGKTSLLRGLREPTLFVDLEGGDLSVADWQGDSIRIRRWEEMRDLVCLIGGPNAAASPTEPFSEAHFAHVEQTIGPRAEVVGRYENIFVDSITVLSRLCMAWAEKQPENVNKAGQKDTRGAYGTVGREMIRLLSHLQHTRDKTVVMVGILDEKKDDFGRTSWQPQMEGSKTGLELPGIVDQVITMQWLADEAGVKHRVFYTSAGNPPGYPAKDRSGKLEPIMRADLQLLLDKINGKA